ncbi:exopolysaccharide Pel transporter PelG [Paenibacillus sp. CF384]|uniref:exopolysaccharide Pel transporter PelG n=1 Tax=Paenibacillus sp. CF384 TaxID=1884382 RepID=UPI000899C4B7|nr:exopolysaccharide Pel transporter PelG [Paenibacillus sp. CF384]SDW66389.1 Uncharacterized membrane protein [Paenibacillus sp. CF384]
MAGIGFELKRLFDKDGLVNKFKAFSYSSLVTIGPMLACIMLVLVVQVIMIKKNIDFMDRELFIACTVYAFTFSYIFSNLLTMFITRTVSDFIYMGYIDALLPSFYGSIIVNYAVGGIPAILFLWMIGLPFALKVALFILFMILVTIWNMNIFISAMKNFRFISYAFVTGSIVAVLLVMAVVYFMDYEDIITKIIFAMDIGFAVTAGMLLVQIERFFRTGRAMPSFSFFAYLRKYPSLIVIGTLNAIGLYSHQFVQWYGSAGEWVGGYFRMAPEYDIAVFYSFISALPTMILFTVALETAFYPQFKAYYSAILSRGSMLEIDNSKRSIYQVIAQQLSIIMGVQLFFSLMAIAMGIRFLPIIGFSSAQIDVYNILVMGFYTYIIFNVIMLILLYFDDRKGVLALSAAFLVLNTFLTIISVALSEQGFSFFIASFITLLLALARLIYLLRNLNYYTFSAQPLIAKEYDNRYTRMLERSRED